MKRILALVLAVFCGCAKSAAPENPRASSGVYYQLFVRSFADSNGDGHGDLRGVLQHLDYLNDGKRGGDDLDVDGIWLLPIHPSPSYHGYDVTDYLGIHPQYGTLRDFTKLVDRTHQRGMQVILDLVLNHTSSEHPWFLDSDSSSTSSHRDWYIWRSDAPDWHAPWPGGGATWHRGKSDYFYGIFYGGMPDLNFRNEHVQDEMLSITREWLRRGVDGFRLDAVRYLYESDDGKLAELPETHQFLKRMRREMSSVNPRAFLVGEAWTDRKIARTYASDGDELHRVFDFDLATAIVGTFNGEKGAPLHDEILTAGNDWTFAATFVSNHDMQRLASRLFDDGDAIKSVLATVMLLPGKVFLYSGDELGTLQSEAGGDLGQRAPLAWMSTTTGWQPLPPHSDSRNVRAELTDSSSFLRWTQKLISLRRNHAALRSESAPLVLDTSDDHVVAWIREGDGERILVVVNASPDEMVSSIKHDGARDMLPLLGGSARSDGDGIVVQMKRKSVGAWVLR